MTPLNCAEVRCGKPNEVDVAISALLGVPDREHVLRKVLEPVRDPHGPGEAANVGETRFADPMRRRLFYRVVRTAQSRTASRIEPRHLAAAQAVPAASDLGEARLPVLYREQDWIIEANLVSPQPGSMRNT